MHVCVHLSAECIVISVTLGSFGVCLLAELKLRARNRLTAGWHISLPLPSVAPRPPGSPLVWSLPPLHITFLPSLVRALLNLAELTDGKSAGRQRQGVHPDKITSNKDRHIIGKTDHETGEAAGPNGSSEPMCVLPGHCFNNQKEQRNRLQLNYPPSIWKICL